MSPMPENYLRLALCGLALPLALAASGCSASGSPTSAADGEVAVAQQPGGQAEEPAAGPDQSVAAPAATAAAQPPPVEVPPPYRPETVSPELREAWEAWARRGVPAEPADGEWQVDELGRRYFTDAVPRMPGAHHLIDDGKRVILPTGLTMDVESYDEETIHVKIYGMPEDAVEARRNLEREAVERQERLAAEYAVDSTTGDALRFTRYDRGLPKRGQWRNGFALADLDGDGHLDIVHGPARKGGARPNVFRGDGAGNWLPWNDAGFPELPLDYGDVAVADFNRDGRLDVAFSSHLRGLVVVVADEAGGFRRWSEGLELLVAGSGETQPNFSSRQIEVVDWNRDGWPDLVALGEGPRLAMGRGSSSFRGGSIGVAIFLNGGDGTWTRAEVPAEEDRVFGDALVVADLDQDGLVDLVIGPSARGRKDLLYRGQPDGSWIVEEIAELREDAIVRSLEVADFDGDGRPDLAVGWMSYWLNVWHSGVDVLLARDDGWERRALGVEQGQAGVWSLAAGDLDADGALDLVAATGSGDLWVFRGDGAGGFERQLAEGVVPPGRNCTGYALALADLDGEPGDELVAAFAGEAGSEVVLQAFLARGESYCPSGGGISAWKASPAAAVSAAGDGAY